MRTTLYKMDASSSIRQWACWNEGPTVFIKHGKLNGQLTWADQTFPSEDDAVVEVRRRITKQIERRGYTETIPECKPLRPMLALDFQDHRDKLPENVIYQPKLDGFRALGTNNRISSRTNTTFSAFPHLHRALKHLPDDICLDGELYIRNSHFQQIMKARADIPNDMCPRIEYHVFDIVDENLSYAKRRTLLSEIITELQPKYEENPSFHNSIPIPFPILPVPSYAGKLDEAKNYLNKFISEGYEGAIVRNPEMTYDINVRSHGLLKFKIVDSDWCTILSTIPSERRPKEGKLYCRTPWGTTFTVALKGTVDQKRDLLKYPHFFINKPVLVEYRGRTADNLPRNAVAVKIVR